MRLGLQGRYTILIASVILMVIVGLSSLMLIQSRSTMEMLTHTSRHEMEHELHSQLEKRGEIMVRLLAENLINPLYLSDTHSIYLLLANTRRLYDVKYVYLLDKEELIVHDGTESIPKLGQHLPDAVSKHVVFTNGLSLERGEGVINVTTPIRLEDLRLGTLLVGISTEGIHRDIAQMDKTLTELGDDGERGQLHSVALATLGFIVVGTILALLLAKGFTQPIKELAAKIKEVGQGKYDIDVAISRQDEIGDLATDFQEMVHRLRDTTVSKDFLDNIINSMNDALIVLHLNGSISMVNAAATRLLAVGENHLLSSRFSSVLAEEETTFNQWLEQVKDKGELFSLETGYRKNDGSIVPVAFSASLMYHRDGRPQWIVCVAQDISERKEIDRVKEEFLSTVSHELRTPLTAIYGALGLLYNSKDYELSEEVRKLVHVAHNNSIQLISLVNDLLDSQKIVSGKMQYDRVHLDLWHVLRESVENNRSYAAQKEVILQMLDDPSIKAIINADPKRLQQVMANLLSNAVKFSHRGGVVEISLQRLDNTVEVSVKDYGEGIPSQFHEHIFERFMQADSSTTRSSGGTGLGLNISKEIIEHMGGEIGFQTEQGKGTRFYFRLPLAQA